VKAQESCSCAVGTSISVKNLFYNVPARRNFLKSEAVEFRHIIDEFERVALAHPEVAFSLHHNNAEVFNLSKTNERQRIVALFGNPYNTRLAPLDESTNILVLSGFIGKPEFAKRSRGEQFFFLNKRFIRNAYLHHAVQSAYSELLPKDTFPSYFIFLEVDPRTIDVNIHPTKTEVKFEDDASIYAILRSSVKKSLGQHNISPTLDFEQEMGIEIPLRSRTEPVAQPGITVDTTFNPFSNEKKANDAPRKDYFSSMDWNTNYSRHAYNQLELLKQSDQAQPEEPSEEQQTLNTKWDSEAGISHAQKPFQLHNRYILAHIKSGFVLIDQQGAHERILYERFTTIMREKKNFSQKKLFPESIELSQGDMVSIRTLLPDLSVLGFDISEFGNNTIAVHGVPVEMQDLNTATVLEGLVEEYKNHPGEFKSNAGDSIARTMARKASIRTGKTLSEEEMNAVIDELFACSMPYATPDGRPTLLTYSLEELERKFKK
jgi:DNA mismatch repair protein MutL